MSISLRGRTQGTSETHETGATQGTQQTHGAQAQQSVRPHGGQRGPDVIPGQGRSEQARRLEQASGRSAQTTCATRPTDSQLAEQYRTMIRAGMTPRIPVAPPLPRADGAALMRELRIPAPRLPALYQRGLDHHGDTHSPIMGTLVNAAAGGHASDQAHGIADIVTHGAVELLSHVLGHGHGVIPTITNGAATLTRVTHGAAAAAEAGGAEGVVTAGAGAGVATGLLLTFDATVLRTLNLAYQVHTNTTPTPESIRAFMQEQAPQVLAQLQAQMQRQLEQQFNTGARAAADQQPLPADASPAFRRGYEEGQRYRAQNGCAYDEHAQALRVLNQVTRGTERDTSRGMRMLSAQPERVAAEINLDE